MSTFVSFHCTHAWLGQHNAENVAQSHLEGAVDADGVEGNEPFWWARNDDLCGLALNTCCLKFDQCHKEQHMISRPPGTSHIGRLDLICSAGVLDLHLQTFLLANNHLDLALGSQESVRSVLEAVRSLHLDIVVSNYSAGSLHVTGHSHEFWIPA